jgi:hypothetical protein
MNTETRRATRPAGGGGGGSCTGDGGSVTSGEDDTRAGDARAGEVVAVGETDEVIVGETRRPVCGAEDIIESLPRADAGGARPSEGTSLSTADAGGAHPCGGASGAHCEEGPGAGREPEVELAGSSGGCTQPKAGRAKEFHGSALHFSA